MWKSVMAGGICTLLFFAAVAALAPATHTETVQTMHALSNWAQGCDPDDLHYGQTNDGQGQRAFIVTCGEKRK